MPKPTEENVTGVESYDHSKVAELVEYHEARKALDALVHAINQKEREVGQAAWLEMVEQLAASLTYSDSSGHKHNECPGNQGIWPYKAVVNDGSLKGWYRCPYCGQEWTIGHYAVNISEMV